MILKNRFVNLIPDTLEEGVLYISIEYTTAIHKCACGCGTEIVTPLAPGGWQLFFDGETISLQPSIGNWNLPCKSHYFIRKNKIEMAKGWTAPVKKELKKTLSIFNRKKKKRKKSSD